MSRITISGEYPIPEVALVASIRSITGAAIRDITTALASGTPLLDEELFGRPRLNGFRKIRGLLKLLKEANVPIVVREDGHRISEQILLNIMVASEESAKELRRLDDLGHS